MWSKPIIHHSKYLLSVNLNWKYEGLLCAWTSISNQSVTYQYSRGSCIHILVADMGQPMHKNGL